MKSAVSLLFSVLIGFLLLTTPLPETFAKTLVRKPVPKLPPRPSEATSLAEILLDRVDPHGRRGVKPTVAMMTEVKACSVCHSLESASTSQLSGIAKSSESCLNCHNSSPHSGVAEHLKHQVSCSSCHSSHRGDEIAWTPSTGRFKGLYDKPLAAEDLVDRAATSAMLKKNCTDCHNKW